MHGAMIPVLSSNIDGYRYLNDKEVLLIAFKGGSTYSYDAVPGSVVQGFMTAASKGTFFGQTIRNSYTATKLDGVAVANTLAGLEMHSQQKPSPRKPVLPFPLLRLKHPALSAMF